MSTYVSQENYTKKIRTYRMDIYKKEMQSIQNARHSRDI